MIANIDKKIKVSSMMGAAVFLCVIIWGIFSDISTEQIIIPISILIFGGMVKEEMPELITFLIPMAALFNAPYVWLIGIIAFLLKAKKIRIRTLLIISLIIIQELISHLIYGISNINRMMGYLITVVLLLYLLNEADNFINYKKCVRMFVLGVA